MSCVRLNRHATVRARFNTVCIYNTRMRAHGKISNIRYLIERAADATRDPAFNARVHGIRDSSVLDV